MTSLISFDDLNQALGFDPTPGEHLFHSPEQTQQRVETRVFVANDIMKICSQTQNSGEWFHLDLQRASLGWEIIRQVHCGVDTMPSPSLALEGVRNARGDAPEPRARRCRP